MKTMKKLTLFLVGIVAIAGLVATMGDVSAASLTSRAMIQLSAQLTNTVGLQTASAPLSTTRTLDLANGVAINQANVIYSSTQSITTGATVSLDFAGGGLLDAFGAAVGPAKVKCVYLSASPNNTTIVTALGDTNNVPILSVKTTSVALTPGAVFLFCDPSLAAIGVTAGTGDIVKLVNAAGATASVDVVVLGTSS